MKRHTELMFLFLRNQTDIERYPEGYSLRFGYSKWAGDDEEINITSDGVEVSCDVPDISEQELLHRALDTLHDKQKNVLAEAEQAKDKIQMLIDRLLLIEHQPDLKVVDGEKPF